MKIPPTTRHLSRLYYELGKMGARSVGKKEVWPYSVATVEELLVLAASLSRWDPRLLEILVQWGMSHWENFRPQQLRQQIKTMETPQTMGVIASFIHAADPDNKEKNLFWNYVTSDLTPVAPQFYFRDLYLPGSNLAEKAAKESLAEFKQWGFLGRERVIIDPTTKKTAGTWDQEARLNILQRLFGHQEKLQISDYLEELGHSISRQQALLDLKNFSAQQQGQGRGAYWTTPQKPLKN